MKRGDILVNQPGPKPGSTKAISQHKAISEGYEAAKTPRRTKTNQPEGKTGCSSAPGMTSRADHAKRAR